jgi:hypothetical protein
MFKSFSKLFVVSMLVVAMTAPVAMATTARVNSLAGTGDYLNDDSNVFRWYGTLPSYSNLVMAEVGTLYNGEYGSWTAGHHALGVTRSCGEEGKYGTWGIFLFDYLSDNVFYSQVNPLGTPDYAGFYQGIPEVPVNKFAIQWGKEFDGLAVGLGFSRSDEGRENKTVDPADPKYNISFTTFGAGIRTDVGENAYADIAATLGLAGGGMTDSTEFDKKMSLDFAGRLFWEWKDYATVVPVVNFGMYEYAMDKGNQYFNGEYGHGEKDTHFNIGAAVNMDVNTNNLLLFGLEVGMDKWEPSKPDTNAADWAESKAWWLPSIFLGLETDVKPWLTVRVASRKTLWKYTEKQFDGGEDMETGADFDWFLGCGFHVAEFDVDCELGPELPFSMGYWLTGYTAYNNAYEGYYSNAPISRISATYHF